MIHFGIRAKNTQSEAELKWKITIKISKDPRICSQLSKNNKIREELIFQIL